MRRNVARVGELAAWGLAVVTAAVILHEVTWEPSVRALQPQLSFRTEPTIILGGRALDSARQRIVATDVFRIARRPTAVIFTAAATDTRGQTTPPRELLSRPTLVLRGLVGGARGRAWRAVLDGIPGRDGSVVARPGDVFGQIHVRHVDANGVVVTGMDTTWRLRLGGRNEEPR